MRSPLGSSKPLVWLVLSAVIIGLDQLTKYLVMQHLIPGQAYHVLPFLNFTLEFNQGAAFSFLGSQSGWQVILFAELSLVAAIVLISWLSYVPCQDWLLCLALSLIIGGALGNFIDRVHLMYVIDFVDFHIGTWNFAIFNVADSAISVGALLLVIKLLFFGKPASGESN